jgi:hypothetical protein
MKIAPSGYCTNFKFGGKAVLTGPWKSDALLIEEAFGIASASDLGNGLHPCCSLGVVLQDKEETLFLRGRHVRLLIQEEGPEGKVRARHVLRHWKVDDELLLVRGDASKDLGAHVMPRLKLHLHNDTSTSLGVAPSINDERHPNCRVAMDSLCGFDGPHLLCNMERRLESGHHGVITELIVIHTKFRDSDRELINVVWILCRDIGSVFINGTEIGEGPDCCTRGERGEERS